MVLVVLLLMTAATKRSVRTYFISYEDKNYRINNESNRLLETPYNLFHPLHPRPPLTYPERYSKLTRYQTQCQQHIHNKQPFGCVIGVQILSIRVPAFSYIKCHYSFVVIVSQFFFSLKKKPCHFSSSTI